MWLKRRLKKRKGEKESYVHKSPTNVAAFHSQEYCLLNTLLQLKTSSVIWLDHQVVFDAHLLTGELVSTC